MLPENETVYRGRFLEKYNNLFFDALKTSGFNPLQGAFWIRTLLRQKQMEVRRKKAESENLMVPPILIYSATRQCNLKCKGCYASRGIDTGKEELPIERVRQLFGEASNLGIGIIMIAGGEPLMKPEVLRAAAENQDIIFPVFTNGMLLNDGSISYFKQHRNLIPILSIEGKRQFTDLRRGTGVYSMLLKSMDLLRKNNQFFGLSVTLNRNNFDEVTHPSWLKLHNRTGCKLFILVEYVPQSQSDADLCLTDQQKKALPSLLEKFRKTMSSLFITLPGDEEKYGGCLAAGRGFIHVSAEGNLEPCPFAPYSDVNIGEISLKEALQSSFLNRIRQSHHMLGEANGGCTLWENRDWVQKQLERSLAKPA